MTNDELKEEVFEETLQEEINENQTDENSTPSEEISDGAESFAQKGEEEGFSGETLPESDNVQPVLEESEQNPKVFRFYKPLPKGVTEETYDEYLSSRKCGNIIGISAIVIWGLVMGYSVIVGVAVAVAAGFGVDLYGVINDPAVSCLMQICMTICMFTLPFLIVAKINKYKIGELAPLGKSREGVRLPYFLFGLGFCAFAQIAVSRAATIFENMGFNYNMPESENPSGILGFLLAVISTAVTPALMEEFGCRGIMFGIAEKRGGTIYALLISSAIFGLIHGNFVQIPFAFLVGLVLGVIRIKTGSLWICILIHGVNNFVSVVMDYAGDIIGDDVANTLYTVFLVICMLCAIVGVALLSGKGKEEYMLEEKAGEIEEPKATLKQKMVWFAKSPAVIIAIILFIGESSLFFLKL